MSASNITTNTIIGGGREEGGRTKSKLLLSEEMELMETIKKIMNTSDSTLLDKEKKMFENDLYTYSLCDDFKSKKTEKVVAYMLNKKNMNILYYADDYKYVIFVNFLRWCQLHSLPIKKYYDLFIKYDISSYPEYETIFQFFLKPAIENDRLLWDVDREAFEEHFIINKEKKKEDENKEKKGNDCHEEKRSNNDFHYNSDMFSSASSSNESTEEKCVSESVSESGSEFDSESESESENASECKSKMDSDFQGKLGQCYNDDISKKERKKKKEKAEENGNLVNKRKMEKNILANWNNLYLNDVVDAIMAGKNSNDDSKNKHEENQKKYQEKTSDDWINKFVKSSVNEQEEVQNLRTKVDSMKTIIKHLISEIIKRDIAQKSYADIKNLNNRTNDRVQIVNKREDTSTKPYCHNVKNEKKENANELKPERKMEMAREVEIEEEERNGVDNRYFDSYNFLEIHRTMILDKVRTNSYYEFINKNKNVFKGKTVLDVGCGSGILSLFCADFCETVVGVDNAKNVLEEAEKIITRNGATNVFLFQGKLEDHTIYRSEEGKIYYLSNSINIEDFEKSNGVKLELLQFDIIISEWMGYFLFYECMIDTILHARKVYLKKGGHIFPNRINFYVSGYDDTRYWRENIQVWEHKLYNKYFRELQPDIKTFLQSGKIVKADKNNIVTDTVYYYTIDLYKYKKKDSYMDTQFKIPVKKHTVVTSLLFHFDCVFEVTSEETVENINVKYENIKDENFKENCHQPADVHFSNKISSFDGKNTNEVPTVAGMTVSETSSSCILSTSPFSEQTHWKQTLLHLYDPCYNLLQISPSCGFSSSAEDKMNSNLLITSDNNSNESMCWLEVKICVAAQSKHTRNLFVVLQICKNDTLQINENLICYYSID